MISERGVRRLVSIYLLATMYLVIVGAHCKQTGKSEPRDGALHLTGEVVAGGTEQEPLLAISSGEGPSTYVVGDLQSELRRLAGAQVSVRGESAEHYLGQAIRVTKYEVLEVNGMEPFVGVIKLADEQLVLQTQDGNSLKLIGLSKDEVNVGSKIWTTGTREDGTLRVQSYGVIRP